MQGSCFSELKKKKKSCLPPQTTPMLSVPCHPPPGLTRSSSGPVAIFLGGPPLRTRGVGHPASGTGGTQHIFRAGVGTVKSPVILQAAHTVHAALENAGTQAAFPWAQELQTRPQKASSPQRWRWRDFIFADCFPWEGTCHILWRFFWTLTGSL